MRGWTFEPFVHPSRMSILKRVPRGPLALRICRPPLHSSDCRALRSNVYLSLVRQGWRSALAKVSGVMTKEVVQIESSATVFDAAKMMNEKGTTGVVVLQNG